MRILAGVAAMTSQNGLETRVFEGPGAVVLDFFQASCAP